MNVEVVSYSESDCACYEKLKDILKIQMVEHIRLSLVTVRMIQYIKSNAL